MDLQWSTVAAEVLEHGAQMRYCARYYSGILCLANCGAASILISLGTRQFTVNDDKASSLNKVLVNDTLTE